MMKRLVILFVLTLDLCVVDADGLLLIFSMPARAQHMELEGGRYDCHDDEIGWYKSPIPCDSLIVEPEDTYANCTYCHGKYRSNEILDHEYACPSRRKDEDPWNPDSGSGCGGSGSGGGGSSDSSGGGGGSAGGGSSSGGGVSSGSSSNASKTTYIKLVTKETVHGVKITVPELCPIGLEGAYMAGYAYEDDDKDVYIKGAARFGWKEDSEILDKYGIQMHDPYTGFDCKLLKKTANGQTAYALAFAGTDMKRWISTPPVLYNPDALTDITQVFCMNPQYMQTLDVAKKLNYVLRNYDLTFVGHSLGGGEAALAAMVTGRYAITYNPAGLSSMSMTWLDVMGYSTDESRIYRYVSTMDEVDFVQYLFGIESQGDLIDVPNVNDYMFEHSIINTPLID